MASAFSISAVGLARRAAAVERRGELDAQPQGVGEALDALAQHLLRLGRLPSWLAVEAGELLVGERGDPGGLLVRHQPRQQLAGLGVLVQPPEVERQAEAGLGVGGLDLQGLAQDLSAVSACAFFS